MHTIKDVLIIGGGIAGAFIQRAFLYEKNVSIHWVDNHHFLASSILAAGITNPITGKRASVNPQAKKLIQKRKEWQQKDELFAQFFVEKNVFRPFKSIYEVNHLSSKNFEIEVTVHYQNPEPRYIYADLGGLEIHNAGYMNVSQFLQEAKKQGNCIDVKLNYQDLEVNPEQIIWKKEGLIFKHVIFCEGSQVFNNPYLSWLNIVPTKGEILEIEVKEEICNQFMYSTGIYIVPKGNRKYFVGATYTPKCIDRTPTEEGKNELIEKLNAFLKVPYQITGHWAGVRPATSDRIPVIGRHPQYPNIWFLNGLGSKGVFYAPLLADCLVNSILYEHPIPTEVDLRKTLNLP